MPLLVRGAPIIVQPVPRLFFSRRCQWRPRGRARDRWRGEVVPDVVHESVVLLNQVIFHLAWDPCHGYGALSTPVTDTDTFDSDTESQWHQRNLSKSRVKETVQAGGSRLQTRDSRHKQIQLNKRFWDSSTSLFVCPALPNFLENCYKKEKILKHVLVTLLLFFVQCGHKQSFFDFTYLSNKFSTLIGLQV